MGKFNEDITLAVPCFRAERPVTPLMLKCIACDITKPLAAFGWKREHKRNKCTACQNKQTNLKVRAKILDAYGRRCACCGEVREQFLTVDHIGNVGHLEKYGGKPRASILRKIIKEGFPKDKYRILCFNCNCSIGIHGFCPHHPEDRCKPAREISQYRRDRIAAIKAAHERLKRRLASAPEEVEDCQVTS